MGKKYGFNFLTGKPVEDLEQGSSTANINSDESDWVWARISAPVKKEEIECTVPFSQLVNESKKLNSSSIFNGNGNASGTYSDISRSTLASSTYSEAVSDFFRNSSSVNMNE